jgi:hypothetical protein
MAERDEDVPPRRLLEAPEREADAPLRPARELLEPDVLDDLLVPSGIFCLWDVIAWGELLLVADGFIAVEYG